MSKSIAQNSDELKNIFTSAFLQYEEQNVIELLDSIFDKNSAEMIETCLNIAKSAAEKCKVKTKFNNTLKHYKKDFAIQKRLEMCTGKISIKNIPKDYTELFNKYGVNMQPPNFNNGKIYKYKREHRNSSNCLYNR